MKMKTLLAVLLFAIGATTATAQDNAEYKFKPHAYLDLQGGAQYTVGETKFKDLLSPNVQAAIGYQFSPVFGLRLAGNGWQSKGAIITTGTENYKFKYLSGNIDLMFNLSNLFCGWNPTRFFNLSAYVGGGANVGINNDEAIDLAKVNPSALEYLWDGKKVRPFGRGGLQIALRLNKCVSFLLEGNVNIISDKYNSKKAGNPDWYYNGLAGLRFNLGAPYTVIPKEAPVVEETYVEPTPEPKKEEPAPVVEKKEEPAPVVIEPLKREIFFLINKTNILPEEANKVKEIADYLNEHKDAKVSIVGYADAGTGNNRINDRLAKLRADSVKKSLVSKYGIAENRITIDSKGSREQPFAENDKNRVSICVAE